MPEPQISHRGGAGFAPGKFINLTKYLISGRKFQPAIGGGPNT